MNVSNQDSKSLKYTIVIDPTTQVSKPTSDEEKSVIYNNLNLITGITINEFATYTTVPYCYTWSPAIMNGKIENNNWKQQSLFALDFDKGLLNIDDALKRFEDLHIHPQLWYQTLSSCVNLIKYRIVLFLDQPIVFQHERINIMLALLKLFPEADQSCKDASRYFFGGQDATILNYEPISAQQLFENLSIQLLTIDKGRTRYLAPTTKFNISNLGEKRDVLYYIYRKYQISPKDSGVTSKNIIPLLPCIGGEKIDWNLARKNVKILDAFLNGEWLYYPQIFGLATNLKYINGGIKLMKNTMLKFNNSGQTNYTENNFNILKFIHKYDYYPQAVFSFSPYNEDNEVYDIISATKNKRGKIDSITPIVKIPLFDAERRFKDSIHDIMSNGSVGKIYLLNLPTAIGKTEMLTKLNGVIALPTNELKNEIGSRMKVGHFITPDPVVFSNQNINNKIDYYYRIGDYQKAISILHDIAKSGNSTYTNDDVEKANNYISQLNLTYQSKKTVLTTHTRVMHSTFNHDTIIFDEDPLKSILEVKQMDLTDLKKIQYEVGNCKELNNIVEYLENTPKIVVMNTPEFNVDINELIDNISFASIQSNIFEFFDSKYFIRDGHKPHIIHYVKMNPLPKDKKIIILSATLPIFIYEKLYGDQLEIIDIRDVEHVGTIKQYTKRSCSRNALKYYVDEISHDVGEKPVLTFKAYSNKFKNPISDMYFGNCSGYDTMNGKDMVVVGTPHRNPIEYMLIAKFLGIEYSTNDLNLDDMYVEFNGFGFMFKTYRNEGLRMIQLTLIESELIQAVGRARVLRKDVLVEVYSNLPLRISNEFVF